ncbi:MAG TPA: UDP-galactopyranose mutase [Fimbriimonadaceae bacterium]|nr:UDP-galactopyranose mutase [Fimbriimonadaceae bacterium]
MTSSGDLVVLSHLRWVWVWQRPQHLISRLAKGRPTFFVEEPVARGVTAPRLAHEEIDGVTRIWYEVTGDDDHVDFDDPRARGYAAALRDFLPASEQRLVWLYTPMAMDLAHQLPHDLMIADVMDDLASFKDASPELRRRQGEMLKEAELVFTGGRSLYEGVCGDAPGRSFLFPSGVEPEHYALARSHASPGKVAGYVGVIDERLDLDLIAGLAERLPDWEIRMVGPVAKISPESLPAAENISYLGKQEYDKLPEIMGGFDVALMPFALNEATRSISPTKTLEYLAAGLPVVSTRVPDVVADYGGVVALEDDGEGFARACREVASHSLEERDHKVSPLIRFHHWDAIANRMEELIQHAQRDRKVVHLDGASAATRIDGNATVRRTTTTRKPRPFDYLVVGAGFAGSVLAERLARRGGKKVLVIDKRPHIGGNAFDHYNDAGVLVHKYGPHIFHTNAREVFEYLSLFTEWRQYEHRVLASVDGRLVPMPINLDTINQLYGMDLTSREVDGFFEELAEPVEHCRTSEDVVVSKVGRELYEKFFRNYTRKQWGLDPSELDASVTSRVPTRTNRDGRYFTDHYQAMPLHGYTRMFENMLDHPNIKVMLNTDLKDIEGLVPYGEMIYSGPVDEFFNFRFGKLPYRSLEFKFETRDEEVAQPAAVINYPNEHLYTRVTEFKYLTGQVHNKTTLVYEYPKAEGDPYYPVPRPENGELYRRYKILADKTPGVHFVGRLATYKYYNMDQVTAQALQTFRRLMKKASAAGSSSVRDERSSVSTTG